MKFFLSPQMPPKWQAPILSRTNLYEFEYWSNVHARCHGFNDIFPQ